MIEVDAHVYRHVGSRMLEVRAGVAEDDYIQVAQVRKLLEEAHRRGVEQGERQAREAQTR